jgi:molecular chaperone GrpE
MTEKIEKSQVKETEIIEEDDRVIETEQATEAETAMDGQKPDREPDNQVDAEATEVTLESLQVELEAAQAEAIKNLEGWQRAVADLANYKRRQEEQASRQRQDITANIIKDILPALDDLDLAFRNLPDSLAEQEAGWVEGFRLVQRKLLQTLEKNNIKAIDADGEFDPNLHEAVTYEDNPDHDSNTIIAELRRGYMIGERVLRPALVRVAQ